MKDKEKKKNKNTLYMILSTITLLISIVYLLYSLFSIDSIINNIDKISIPLFTFIISIILFITVLKSKEKIKIYNILSILLIVFMLFNLASTSKIIKLPEEEKLLSYTNTPYHTFSKWAKENNINLIPEYEYNDSIEEGNIIRLNVNEGALIKDIKEITVTISDGPNYDKLIIIPSMIGWTVDDTVKYIKENHLTNVIINFEASSDEKDTILKQSTNGEIRRNQELILTASLGGEVSEIVTMTNLVNMDLFDSTLWLKRNNIKYTINYEFSDKVKRNVVINQNIEENKEININEEEVILTISKGKSIKLPDFTTMTVDKINDWIIENKLKVAYNEVYDEKIETGKVISQDIEANSLVEINTLITITISRGQIKMEEFDSLYKFKEWANKYDVAYNESYEYSNSISKGNVISYSYNVGDIIDPNGVIYVKVSLGKAVSIPSFIGKTKSQAQSTCSSIGLNCSFTSGNYTGYAKDIIYSQSRAVGNKVTSGSSITLTLSKGVPKQYTLAIGSWELKDNATSTINNLTNVLSERYPGVVFKFNTKPHNTFRDGLVHPDSTCNNKSTIKQGETCTITIVSSN